MENVTHTAVWGSLIASAFLGAFILVQAWMDRERRARYLAFAMVCWGIAIIDFVRPQLGVETYEIARLFVWAFYGASVAWLNGWAAPHVAAAGAVPLGVGIAVWFSGHHDQATTSCLPLSLGIAAVSHATHYVRFRGYASGVLSAYSAAMAILCAAYWSVVATKDVRVITLGYAHWALLNVLAVVFGWVHAPREMRGRAPVAIEPGQAVACFIGVVGSEVLVIAGLISTFSWPPTLYLVGSVGLSLTTVLLYFHHRHRLVIWTDNVAALLEERTHDLRAAQQKLAETNEEQARMLDEQARQLETKSAVIERQRRLELAAQTAGQAAHDIQNLLAPILGQISRLDSAHNAGSELQSTAAQLRRQVGTLLELNGQLLALARRGRLEMNPVRLSELLSEMTERFEGSGIQVEIEGEPWLMGSWSQLLRALTNLVGNALEVQRPGTGPVRVRGSIVTIAEPRRCHLGFLPAGRHAAIQVQDSGPGVPPEYQEKIFEPFFSLKKGSDKSGSGLGLAIVTAVVDDHRGVLDMETGSSGTTFTLYLPAAAAPVPQDALYEVVTDAAGDVTVLVVDDDAATRAWCSRILEEAGYSVLAAQDGAEAIRIIQMEHVDALLLDLKLPHLSGFETFFGALHMQPHVRAIVHSSYVSDSDSLKLRQHGVSAVLIKPAGRREILTAVHQALEERSLAPAASR